MKKGSIYCHNEKNEIIEITGSICISGIDCVWFINGQEDILKNGKLYGITHGMPLKLTTELRKEYRKIGNI